MLKTSRKSRYLPFDNPLLEVGVPAADADLFGKVAADLQSSIVIGANKITGTSKYVTGYTDFSQTPALQSGNYLAIHVKCQYADSVKAGVDPTEGSGLVEIPGGEDDIVCRLSDTQTQKFVIEITDRGVTTRKEYTLELTREDS